MIVDASAVLAILLAEPEAESFIDKLNRAAHCRMSVVNFFEAAIVIESRRSAEFVSELEMIVERTPIDLAPVTVRQAELARDAWRRFGKGRRPRGLNLGDCFAYALAADTGEPLLFKGDDFTRTDVVAA